MPKRLPKAGRIRRDWERAVAAVAAARARRREAWEADIRQLLREVKQKMEEPSSWNDAPVPEPDQPPTSEKHQQQHKRQALGRFAKRMVRATKKRVRVVAAKALLVTLVSSDDEVPHVKKEVKKEEQETEGEKTKEHTRRGTSRRSRSVRKRRRTSRRSRSVRKRRRTSRSSVSRDSSRSRRSRRSERSGRRRRRNSPEAKRSEKTRVHKRKEERQRRRRRHDSESFESSPRSPRFAKPVV